MDELKQKYFSNNSSYYEDLFRKGISNTSNKLEDFNEKTLINMENEDQQQNMVSHLEDIGDVSNDSKENHLQGGQKRNLKKNAEAICKIKQKGQKTNKVSKKKKKKVNRKRKAKPRKHKNTIFD